MTNFKGTCDFDGCLRQSRYTRGLCAAHALQKQRGMTLRPLRVYKDDAKRMADRTEKTAGCWNWTGYLNHLGYSIIYISGKPAYAHRVAFESANGPIPDGLEVDHVCHNRGCVRPDHLRLATRKQNVENHRGANKNSISGVRGVRQNSVNSWSAKAGHNGVIHRGGSFPTKEQAEAVAIALRTRLHSFNDLDRYEAGRDEP